MVMTSMDGGHTWVPELDLRELDRIMANTVPPMVMGNKDCDCMVNLYHICNVLIDIFVYTVYSIFTLIIHIHTYVYYMYIQVLGESHQDADPFPSFHMSCTRIIHRPPGSSDAVGNEPQGAWLLAAFIFARSARKAQISRFDVLSMFV